jgi:hypothetical protein
MRSRACDGSQAASSDTRPARRDSADSMRSNCIVFDRRAWNSTSIYRRPGAHSDLKTLSAGQVDLGASVTAGFDCALAAFHRNVFERLFESGALVLTGNVKVIVEREIKARKEWKYLGGSLFTRHDSGPITVTCFVNLTILAIICQICDGNLRHPSRLFCTSEIGGSSGEPLCGLREDRLPE